jgi:hypothetical protein
MERVLRVVDNLMGVKLRMDVRELGWYAIDGTFQQRANPIE